MVNTSYGYCFTSYFTLWLLSSLFYKSSRLHNYLSQGPSQFFKFPTIPVTLETHIGNVLPPSDATLLMSLYYQLFLLPLILSLVFPLLLSSISTVSGVYQVDDYHTSSSSPVMWGMDPVHPQLNKQHPSRAIRTSYFSVHKTGCIILPLKPVSHPNWPLPIKNQTIHSII